MRKRHDLTKGHIQNLRLWSFARAREDKRRVRRGVDGVADRAAEIVVADKRHGSRKDKVAKRESVGTWRLCAEVR